MTKRVVFLALAIILAAVISEDEMGCKKDEDTVNPPPDTTNTGSPYGSGSMSFTTVNGGGAFSVNGPYKTSNQFANDTSSQGAGGFVKDTSLFGKLINAMFVGYTHVSANGSVKERLLVLSLHDSVGSLVTGDYSFSRSNATSTGQRAYVYFFLTDSVNFYELFVPKAGTITLSMFDAATRHAQGTFSGTLWSPSDTTKQIQLTNGQFDLQLVNRYFSY
ncbi:MAG: hypothetical protein HYR76_09790 [Ignavibacteria bacterium]|nr:hypothetical protein [Ignavibacteria bacterium]MBI3766815.1 hypothetical protein [Ignavibacteriales bacterium]